MFAGDHNWVPFNVVACSSEEYGTEADLISNQPYPSHRSWESAKTAEFPVEIVIRFHSRCELDHVAIQTKPDKNIPEMEFHIGDGLSGSFLDVEYRVAGSATNLMDKLTQVKLSGVGGYLKLVFKKAPKRSNLNPFGQVSIGALKIWGRITGYHKGVKNEQLPLVRDKADVEKILVGMGIPLDLLAWFEEDERNFEFAPIDSDTRQTLKDLDDMRYKAIQNEEYEALKALSLDIKKVFEIGKEIWKLQKELEFVVAKEDFNKAMDIKEKLKKLIAKRDSYDALYETSRYEQMVVLARPTTADMRALQQQLEDQDNYERMRRQKELEEDERRRILEHQKQIQQLEEKKDVDFTPHWEKNQDADVGRNRKKKKEEKKQSEETLETNFTNPFAYNEGDVDMDQYFRPLIMNAGENMKDIPIEVLRRLHHLGYLTVFGAKVWTAAHSENWRIREAAVQAVLNFLEMPIVRKSYFALLKARKIFEWKEQETFFGGDGDCENSLRRQTSSNLFCWYSFEKNNLIEIGLKIISTALAPPICGTDVSPQMINKVLKEFLPILITKISELNYRARDISLHTLLSLFRHPASEIGNLIVCCMDIVDFEEDIRPKNNIPIDKQQWRIVLARLEIILHVLQEFGYDPTAWNWDPVFKYLIVPSLFHSNVDVRLLAVELTISFYQLLGQEVRMAVNNIENIKPNLLHQIIERMDDMDKLVLEKHGGAVPGNANNNNQNNLSQVDEREEENASNPGTSQNKKRPGGQSPNFELVEKDPNANRSPVPSNKDNKSPIPSNKDNKSPAPKTPNPLDNKSQTSQKSQPKTPTANETKKK